MKKLVLFVIITLLFLNSVTIFAFQNEPDGFRGIKWGTNIKELPDMVPLEGGDNLKIYTYKNDKMQIGEAKLENIVYLFYKNQLMSVIIDYKSYLNFTIIKETFSQQYGASFQPNRFLNDYYWQGNNVDIAVNFSKVTEKGGIFYSYKPLSAEEKKDSKDKAKKGAKDL